MSSIRLLVAGVVALAFLVLPGAPASADAAGQSRDAVIAQYQSVLLPALAVKNDWTGSVNGCVAGTTGPAYQAATLTAINYVRGLAGLSAVSFDPVMNSYAQDAALVMLAQGALNHTPPSDWRRWSEHAYVGASHSNLSLGHAGGAAILGQMADRGASNALAGHRRWILNSGTVVMGTGDTSRSNALLVFGGPVRQASTQWVPWPTAGYFPMQLEPAGRWSLARAGANFSSAIVTASVGGQPLPVIGAITGEGYGDNTLAWDMTVPAAWSARRPPDALVDVTVSGIRLPDGSVTSYSYSVNLVDAAPRLVPDRPAIGPVTRVGGAFIVQVVPGASSFGSGDTLVLKAKPLGRKGTGLPTRTCTTKGILCQITGTVRSVPYRLTLVARNDVGDSPADVKIVPAARH